MQEIRCKGIYKDRECNKMLASIDSNIQPDSTVRIEIKCPRCKTLTKVVV